MIARRDSSARAEAQASERAPCARPAPVAARRHSADGEGQPVHRATCPPPGARRPCANTAMAMTSWRWPGTRGRRADHRQDQRARVRAGGLHGQPDLRRDRQSLGPGAHARAAPAAARWRRWPAASRRWRSARMAAARSAGRPSHTGLVGLKPSLQRRAARACAAQPAAGLRGDRAAGAHGGRCAHAVRRDARAWRPWIAPRWRQPMQRLSCRTRSGIHGGAPDGSRSSPG